MNLFRKGLDSGYRPSRRRLTHESEQSCSAIQTLTVYKQRMRFDIIRRGTIDLATLDSQRHRKKGASKVRDSFGLFTRGAQDACLPGRLEFVFETSIYTLLKKECKLELNSPVGDFQYSQA